MPDGIKPVCPSATWAWACTLLCVTQVALGFRLTKGTVEARQLCPFPKKMSEAVSSPLPPTLVIFLGTSAAETCFQEECSKDSSWFPREPEPNQPTPKALSISCTEPHVSEEARGKIMTVHVQEHAELWAEAVTAFDIRGVGGTVLTCGVWFQAEV